MSIRVCIADDHLLFLSGIRQALEGAEHIDVVGSTHRADEIVALVDSQHPDLLLLDHTMPGSDGVTYIKRVRERHPTIKVVILSASEDRVHIAEALCAGADAYIGKRIDPDDLASVLRQVVAGVVYHSGPDLPAADTRPSDLTERELTMLVAITQGLSTKAISRELWISEKTVKFHLTNIYRKLGVHNRTGAMRCAIERDLIALQPQAAGAAIA